MTKKRGERPTAPGTAANSEVAEMIRVDHAGEYGAMCIYRGQLAILERRAADRNTVAAVRRMAEQEARHLDSFERLINERKVRPTALSPLWQVAGYALGAGTALLGSRAAMACTVAVEEVIDEHYGKQIKRLGHDPSLRRSVRRFQADERAHRNEALAHGAADAAGYPVLSGAIKAACRVAIHLSEKI